MQRDFPILIVGGTGVFGSRLARMLIEEGWPVTITSRNLRRARAFTDHFGGTPLALDRDGDLTTALQNHRVVVDAAGPFQGYGKDPYHLARTAIAQGIHYLDLSDDAAFTLGITTLQEQAEKHQVCALSGVSSVPALSSAAVTCLAQDIGPIRSIETAILPGNRAPRGLSGMQAILTQVGAPLDVWRNRQWHKPRAWSSSRTYQLAPDISRTAALIGAPDLRLFPEHCNADTVEFRAGLELGIMQHALFAMSWLRGIGLFPNPVTFARPLQWIARWMEGIGSDRGGMVLQVENHHGRRKSWTLLAEAGDGPFIPAIPALICIGKLSRSELPFGARPALDAFTLSEAQSALSRLNITTHITDETSQA